VGHCAQLHARILNDHPDCRCFINTIHQAWTACCGLLSCKVWYAAEAVDIRMRFVLVCACAGFLPGNMLRELMRDAHVRHGKLRAATVCLSVRRLGVAR
jgi:hypothetical protein